MVGTEWLPGIFVLHHHVWLVPCSGLMRFAPWWGERELDKSVSCKPEATWIPLQPGSCKPDVACTNPLPGITQIQKCPGIF